MMEKKKVLILTDHKNHSSENSLYELSVKMLAHEQTECVDIATSAIAINANFFACHKRAPLFATTIDSSFAFNQENHPLAKNYKQADISTYDLVWLRLPPPLDKEVLTYFSTTFSNATVINDPRFIFETGSKAFLVNFPSVCPPMKVCNSLEDIIDFKRLFPIVLKPFNDYGGKGIYRVEDDLVRSGQEQLTFKEFADAYMQNPKPYLAVKFLKNVKEGDKRIIVVNGVILGASLRLPAENSWLCNVAMGGSSNMAQVDKEEEEIIRLVNPILSEMGIVMYGVDTLVGDDGKRLLSEINTTSIGGLPQIAKMNSQPLVEKAINLIWGFYNDKMKENG